MERRHQPSDRGRSRLRRISEQEFTLLGRLKKRVGISKPVTDQELSDWSELVYDSCSLCGRCSMVCPVGNDVGKRFGFKLKHIVEILDELREQGLLKTEGLEQDRLTFHDPCQLVRRAGVEQQPRNRLNMVSKNFVEMEDHGTMNWCCGAGGGVSSSERADKVRKKAFLRKRSQIERFEIDTLVTACANCRMQLEQGIEDNEMNIPVVGLTEMLAEHLVVKDQDQAQEKG